MEDQQTRRYPPDPIADYLEWNEDDPYSTVAWGIGHMIAWAQQEAGRMNEAELQILKVLRNVLVTMDPHTEPFFVVPESLKEES